MTIVVTGGGSGGHITPALAVADALKRQSPENAIVYIGQTGDKLADLAADHAGIDSVLSVQAGKLRRYHGEGWRQLLDLRTMALNIRDMFRVSIGLVQAFFLLGRLKPSVIFIKGGFVGVPVGLAAALRGIPYVTHDSDAIPGLANRLIGRWARTHAVALPKEMYAYPAHKTVTVGVPVSDKYEFVDVTKQRQYREKLGLTADVPVLAVTGGGLGAQRLNTAMTTIAPKLLQAYPALVIFHTAGRSNETAVQQAYDAALSAEEMRRVHVLGYSNDLYRYTGAADLVVMRAGATAIAECAVQGKACILAPNPYLTGGHQLKNAEALAAQDAVEIVAETILSDTPEVLLQQILRLLESDTRRQALGQALHTLAHPNSADELAVVLLKEAHRKT